MSNNLTSSRAKRLTLQGLLAASVVGLGIAGAMLQVDPSNPVEAAQAGEGPQADALDPLTHSRVRQVRRESGLGNKDLAALGLTHPEASSVLNRLAQWCEANEAAITQARQAVNTARRELREQQRLVRIGQASERQLLDAGDEARSLVDAQAAHDRLIDQGATHAMQAPGLAPGKVSAWRDAAAWEGRLDSDLRYLPGMDEDRLQTLRSEARRRGVALEHALLTHEQEHLAALRERARLSMPGVLVAEAVALPVPRELHHDGGLVGEAPEAE